MSPSLMDEPVSHTTVPVILRPASAADAVALVQLAELLDTMNLPRDPETIASIITESEASFARLAHPGPAPTDTAAVKGTYTLVALQGERLLGTASLLSHHGTPQDPHYYLRVIEQTLHSKQLNTERQLHLLRLERDEVPWTELGGLVVHPEARGKGLGKLLVAARLLLVSMHQAYFCQRLLAELLPPQREDGSNAFWDALGGPLTGLNYYRADLLCRTDKEFIDALFPHQEIVLELMPPEAQAVVGQVGPATMPVCHILRRAGFHYLETVDPFDGGPHYGARREDIQPMQRSRALVCLDLPPTQTSRPVLLGNPVSHCFHAAPAEICRHGIRLDKDVAELLHLHPGDVVWLMPLDW
jgi:arginine N-succinyltransferase